MLSLNIGLTGLSEITRMSEIRRFYPNFGPRNSARYFGLLGLVRIDRVDSHDSRHAQINPMCSSGLKSASNTQ